MENVETRLTEDFQVQLYAYWEIKHPQQNEQMSAMFLKISDYMQINRHQDTRTKQIMGVIFMMVIGGWGGRNYGQGKVMVHWNIQYKI